jgi:trans-feruloyl-CoA hydratase/vanillin synthase
MSETAIGSLPQKNVLVRVEDGIGWVSLNRPEKRNAINPAITYEMNEVLDRLEEEEAAKVIVISGSGDSFSAGMDLKEYFREPDAGPPLARERLHTANARWQWRRLMYYPKPTIAMVNGWCFGGAFQFLCACDLAVAADDASFGLSEINWGIIPAGIVTKSVAMALSQRKAMYYIMTGETFDGKEAENIGLVNFSVPSDEVTEKVKTIARTLMEKNPHVLRACKVGYHYVRDMSMDMAAEYLASKFDSTKLRDPEQGAGKGMSQFLDEKSFRPGLEAYKRA